MKKLLSLSLLLTISSLAMAVEMDIQNVSTTEVAPVMAPAPIVLTKTDSFMTAFGMQDMPRGGNNIVDGEENIGDADGDVNMEMESSPNTAAVTARAHNVVSHVSSGLTSVQNTPYSYK